MSAQPDKKTTIAYWILTVLFLLPMAGSAFGYLSRSDAMVESFTHLGYPIYFMLGLGVAKLLGVVGILQPVSTRIKEWAYAGFGFTLVAASISHGVSGDGPAGIIPPLVMLGFVGASYTLWTRKRRTQQTFHDTTASALPSKTSQVGVRKEA